jgi:DNA polymerase-3 subunit gamma/tau
MTVLYRTYRPRKWSDVVGQESIVSSLKDSIEGNNIAHAYLFSGSRGTGKTSVARIFASAVKTADEDIYEIDAASNRGIDDIRHLREHVSVLPFSSTYKVYIIDEVHMLSKDAWNALLKTLEEPPVHVIFILATTEIEKVPDTIISRCQTFVFRKPSRDIIRGHISKVAKSEGYDIDQGAADLIAMLGDGSFRDALGTLQKIISSSEKSKKISRDMVEEITGAPKAELVNRFIDALISKNSDGALVVLNDVTESDLSMITFVTLIMEKIRFIFLLQNSPGSASSIKERVSPDDMAFIEKQASRKVLNNVSISTLIQAQNDIGRSSIDSLPLELAVVSICG